jgi:hypothetical protein
MPIRSMTACGWVMVLATASAASAQSPTPRTGDPWQLRQNAESCYLDRTFDTGAGKVELLIQSFGTNSPYHFILRGSNLPSDKDRARPARVGFGGDDAAKDAVVLVGSAGAEPMVLMMVEPPHPVTVMRWFYSYTVTRTPTIIPLDSAAEKLFFEFPGKDPISLPLGPMQSEYAALDGCVGKLVQTWSTAASKGSRAVTAPELLHSQEALWHVPYPANLLLNRVNGVVELRMTVSPEGRARDCKVQMATWVSQFGADACEKFKEEARFEPAHDSSGKPIAALFRTSVMFIIYDW